MFRCSASETTRRFEVRQTFALTIVQCIVSATRVFESTAKKSKGHAHKNYDNPDLELQLPITASVGNSTPTSDEHEIKMNKTFNRAYKCLTRY